MTLRMAHPTDASSIAALSLEVWLGTYLRKGISAAFADFALNAFTPQKTAALIEDPGQIIWVSQNEEGIDGVLRIASNSPAPVPGCSDMEIATVYVQPRHHGKGIGKRLLLAALEYGRAAGVGSVWLATNAENTPAIGFYLAQGFEPVGETRFWIDATAYPNTVFRRAV